MSKERWTDAKTKAFITRYIKQPSLWNISDPGYALKANKEAAYNELQNEFNMTLTEARNKIRIYRTTYAQELKRMESNSGYVPKLAWFNELHSAFHQGKVKSFIKTPSKKKKDLKTEKNVAKYFEISYLEESTGSPPGGASDDENEIKNPSKSFDEHHLIIEPYEDEPDEVETSNKIAATPRATTSNNNVSILTKTPAPSPSVIGDGMLSNELFLKSLQATLDKLPDDKNMRARIKIQEVLYNIAYDK